MELPLSDGIARRPSAVEGLSHVSRETRERLAKFLDLLFRWNERISLIGPSVDFYTAERHVVDSLQLCPLIPAAARRAADVGTGAGFPGLVLAIARAIPFLLIERDQRKAAFLREAVRLTDAPATVMACPAEAVHSTVEVVTSRAVADVGRLLQLTSGLRHAETSLLLLKSRLSLTELADARRNWTFAVRQIPSIVHDTAAALTVTKIRPR